MLTKVHISIVLLLVGTILAAPQPEYRVEEQGNNMILITPDGRRILFGEHNLPSEKSYEFTIPLSALSDEPSKPIDRTPASVSTPPSPTPSPFYDVDWDWEEPDEDPIVLATPTPTPTPTPTVKYDGSDALILKANRLFHKGKYYEAALYVEEVLRKNPDHMRAWLMKGSVLFKMGQKEMAQRAWRQAITLDPANKETEGILERFK